KLF
ncbi:hypothetical protein D047_0654B, partial [Vibrio parahaemolyticus VPTS-2010_2]